MIGQIAIPCGSVRRAWHTCGRSRRRNRARVRTNHSRSLVSHAPFHGVHTCIRPDESFPPSAFRRLRPSCNRITFRPARHAVAPRWKPFRPTAATRVKRVNVCGHGYHDGGRLTDLDVVKVQSLCFPLYHLACELIRRVYLPASARCVVDSSLRRAVETSIIAYVFIVIKWIFATYKSIALLDGCSV